MFLRTRVVSPLLACALFSSGLNASEFLDGRALLQQLQVKEAAGASESKDPEARRRQLAGLSAEEAAAQWLVWVDEFLGGGEGDLSRGRNDGFAKLVQALPDPSAWEALSEKIGEGERDAFRQLHLDFLGAVLAGDANRQWETLLAIEENVLAKQTGLRGKLNLFGGGHQDYLREAKIAQLGELMEAFLQMSDDPERVKTLLQRRVKHPDPEYGPGEIVIPDLATLLGESEARELIQQLLRESSAALRFELGQKTRDIAREVALEQKEELQAAPWGLIDSLDHVELYEALNAKFPASEDSRHDYQRNSANVYYLLGLVIRDRGEEATKLLKESNQDRFYLPYDLTRDLQASPHREKIRKFLEEALAQNPDLPLWEAYFSISAAGGNTASAIPFIESMLESRDWEPAARLKLRERLAAASLSADRVSEGIEMIREDARGTLENGSPNRSVAIEIAQAGIRMAKIGLLLDNADWRREGVEIAEKAAKLSGDSVDRLLGNYFEQAGEWGRAQEIRIRQLRTKIESFSNNRWGNSDARSELVDLARLYYLAERPDDVIVLLEEAPWWGVADLAEMIGETGSGKEPVGFLAAWALAKTGETEKAVSILRELLLALGGYDPAYELFAEIDPDGAVSWFDRLFALDPFEERPLIWKAIIVHEKGRAAEAKQLIEKAIATDPSDGEQGPGRRMRAYQVLSDLFAEEGNAEKAEFFAGVVASIRMSEEADALFEAGLRERAIALYQESLGHFADAYCIQSRLARQLQEMGKHEEAQAHYQRAYELMPDSFGRVESHCFGCEAAFSGERAQSTAERVFAKMREERPEQPQVWYLSGYLDFERGNFGDATRHLLRAVELDPDYLNAWSKLASIGSAVHLDREIRDRAALQILRLDPLQRHARAELDGMSDLRALWEAVEQAAKRQPKPVDRLLALPAVETKPESGGGIDEYYSSYIVFDQWNRSRRFENPAAVLAEHSLLREVAASLDLSRVE